MEEAARAQRKDPMRVAFLGTGAMGHAMAGHLLQRGHSLWVWNRTRDKALSLQDKGAVVVERVEDAIAAAEVVVTMLYDAHAIRETLLQPPAVRDTLRNRTLISCSTIAPTDSRLICDEVRALGADYIEAPVLGATPVAQQGALQVLVSATKEHFKRLAPLFSAFGTPHHVSEEVGKALTLKLSLNQIVLGEIVLLANSLAMVKNAGMSEELLLSVLRPSQLYAKYYDLKTPSMVSRDFSSIIFDISGAKKDIELIAAEAKRLGLNVEAIESMRHLYTRASEENPGSDYVAVYNTINPPQPPQHP